MKYQNIPNFEHGAGVKVGVLITNLGTPQAANARALRPYLHEFLSDPRVVELPRLLWKMVLHGIILRIRPARAAKAYQKVWTEEGSPLAVITRKQYEKLSATLKSHYGDKVVVCWAMRYGQPAIRNELQKLAERGVRKLFVLPLYPQYSGSTTGSTFDAIAEDFKRRRWLPELRFLNGYHQHDAYIDALADSIRSHFAEHGQPQKLVFSYHGVPLRYLHNGDPYHCFCLQTTRLVIAKLGLNDEEYLTTFQSRFGREPWLQPYTDHSLEALAKDGVKSVSIICPGSSSDCLETLEEIDQENREIFLHAGGEEFSYIPALNDQDVHINMLALICKSNIDDWLKTPEISEAEATQSRYNECPYNRKPN